MDLDMDTYIVCLLMLIGCTWLGIAFLNYKISRIPGSLNTLDLLEIFEDQLTNTLSLKINNLEEQNVWLRKDMDRLVASLDKRLAQSEVETESHRGQLRPLTRTLLRDLNPLKKQKRKYTKKNKG